MRPSGDAHIVWRQKGGYGYGSSDVRLQEQPNQRKAMQPEDPKNELDKTTFAEAEEATNDPNPILRRSNREKRRPKKYLDSLP